ncbi:ATP-binding cassette domain-containing protein [Pradoshia sp. D12]|uniref:ABC transporter ATP-binding protein n=1 Tax=Bacillaceae TaxID=186817 RepID=UPI00080ADCCE|nr:MULTISPECIES: ABC transporter transmembrane domain-containing protein [Bacillaceae]OCA86239.1 multidrug ABC transporter permease/ATP-binding protein [Bacillus sp. FJAT-27986]QFK72032.1 ATP-binding cassette domain-containing protein [Pradoshia sp. D12]TPF71476.1 ATP-binding cassette domain-containing protein [Bacillus sp. D12]
MFSVLKKLGWFFKEHWIRYTVAIALLNIVNVLEVLPPMIVGMAIDDMSIGEMNQETLMTYVWWMIGLMVTLYILTYIWNYQLFSGAYVLERKLRSGFIGHLLKMTPTFYEKNRTGDLMARATNDLKSISVTAGFGILTLMDSTLYMIAILATMAITISWELTLAAILPLPIMAWAVKKGGERIHEHFTVAQDAFGELNDKVLESVAGVRVIRAYVQERADEKRFEEMTEDVYEKNMKVTKVDAMFDPVITFVIGISYLISLGYGANLVFAQAISIGQLVTFNVYLSMLIWPMIAIGELINVMQRGNASLDRMNETLSSQEDVKNDPNPVDVPELENVIFDQVVFRYPSSKVDNLADINVKIDSGDTIGIVGKTGSGKTTFVKQLLREYPAGNGILSLSDVPIEKQNLEDVREWIGYVPQDHVLFSKTVRENILFGKMEATDEEFWKAVRLADFEKDIERLPNRLETLVGEKGIALSGGQKQRISIARALIKDPEILILDDSLSAVDAKTETTIIENIRNERSDKTTIITTHRLSAVQHADWIIVLDDGVVIEEGTHEMLLNKKGWYKEQFDRQQIEANKEVSA